MIAANVTLALLVTLAGAMSACGGLSSQSLSGAGQGCPATVAPPSALASAGDGIRGELAATRTWQEEQASALASSVPHQGNISVTFSLLESRPTMHLEEIVPREAVGAVRDVFAGFPSHDGFYAFELRVDAGSAPDPIPSLLSEYEAHLQGMINDMMSVANNPSRELAEREGAERMALALDAESQKAKTRGLPIYALSLVDVPVALASQLETSRFPRSVLARVPMRCDVVKPLFPDEALESWGAVEDRGRSDGKVVPIEPAPVS